MMLEVVSSRGQLTREEQSPVAAQLNNAPAVLYSDEFHLDHGVLHFGTLSVHRRARLFPPTVPGQRSISSGHPE